MRHLPKIGSLASPLFVLLAIGCQASVEGDNPSGSGAAASGGSASGGSAGGSVGATGGAQSMAGTSALPPGSEAAALLPARIRRLTVAEYQATVSAADVIGADAQGITADFVPDSRQSGFTVNEAQRVDPVFAGQLSQAATAMAASLRQHIAERASCTSGLTDQCADAFIRSFGERAYRRPLGGDEVAQLMTVFHTAVDGGSYDEGIELVVRAMLQSAGFLYLTEIGDAPGATVKLTPYELAASISYLVRGGPPSAALLDAAKAGTLDTAEGRAGLVADAKIGLFAGAEASARVSRVVREWLGTDRVSEIAKDTTVYPDFAGVKADIAAETTEFLNTLVRQDGQGSLRELLGANWTMASSRLANLYGVTGPKDDAFQQVSTPNRLGILNQGAFLSVFAHAHETAPVLRGVAVMRRIACMYVGDPVNLTVVPPVPDPTLTTRQRFANHAVGTCTGCHDSIDNFGFAFEQFDGMGKFRTIDGTPTADNDHVVDSSVVVAGTDFDGSYPDSNALATALSTSPQVRECFARHVFRALGATSDPALSPSENDFVKYWNTTLPKANDKVTDAYIIGTISAFLSNPSFNHRRAQ
ncbi:MAG TPA: DUF1592 domain-containing protein [Polyangiaceae bacterium]|nr:DUF1592 domain-containing protein [Polyangiaceae bacterium]